MTMPMPAAGTIRGPQARPRRRSLRAVLAVFVLVVLLVPVVYLFTRVWTAVGDAAATTASERAAVAYGRPLDKLLAALVDTQYSAARRGTVDFTAVRGAVDDVNALDRQSTDPLGIRPRWTQLRQEVDNALDRNPTGADALHAYAAPIALAQALLAQIADSSGVTRDPGQGAYQLTQVALRSLPAVLVNAGQVSALIRSGTADPRLTIAEDRLAQAATDVSIGLRGGTDPSANYAIDLNLLGPLDEFVAAADTLSQTAAGPDAASGGAADRIDTATTLVKTKALGLESAVLNVFDSQLAAQADRYTGERRLLVLAALVVTLAAAVLLWLRVPAPAGPRPQGGADDSAEGRHRHSIEGGGDIGPEGMPHIPDLVDARDLLPPPLAQAGRGRGPDLAGPR
jgi:hypothetical protein